jgi:hypothetical protein
MRICVSFTGRARIRSLHAKKFHRGNRSVPEGSALGISDRRQERELGATGIQPRVLERWSAALEPRPDDVKVIIEFAQA